MKQVKVFKKTSSGLDFYQVFKSIKDASVCLGIHKSQISRCLNKVEHYKSARGYVFYPYDLENIENN